MPVPIKLFGKKDRPMGNSVLPTYKTEVAAYPDVMNYHRYNITPLNDLLMAASSPPASLSRPETNSDVIRIAWLRHFTSSPDQVSTLMDKFADFGMDVWLVNGEHLPSKQISCFDLILLETPTQPTSTIYASIERIRHKSKVPLILLTDDYTVQWSIDALRAGADAILPLNTSSDVVLARCRSLLRRWLSDV